MAQNKLLSGQKGAFMYYVMDLVQHYYPDNSWYLFAPVLAWIATVIKFSLRLSWEDARFEVRLRFSWRAQK
jgi:hypothetical protein